MEKIHQNFRPKVLDHAEIELQILENILPYKSQNPLKNISLEIGAGYLKTMSKIIAQTIARKVKIMNMYTVSTKTLHQIIRDQQGFIMWYNMKSMPKANCKLGILKYDPSECEEWYIVILKSYDKIVAGFIVDDATLGVFCTGTYSRTTAKQITKFCREFCTPLDSHWMKKLANSERQVVVVDSENLNYTVMRIISDYVESKHGKGVR